MLKDEIEEAKRTISTDSVQITIGEVANMYRSDELNIIPDFQRLFRWSDDRKSNFVESILIGIPIPPAFEDGEQTLDKALQLFFRRHRFDFQILKHPSDPKTKYDLFQRLNR